MEETPQVLPEVQGKTKKKKRPKGSSRLGTCAICQEPVYDGYDGMIIIGGLKEIICLHWGWCHDQLNEEIVKAIERLKVLTKDMVDLFGEESVRKEDRYG